MKIEDKGIIANLIVKHLPKIEKKSLFDFDGYLWNVETIYKLVDDIELFIETGEFTYTKAKDEVPEPTLVGLFDELEK